MRHQSIEPLRCRQKSCDSTIIFHSSEEFKVHNALMHKKSEYPQKSFSKNRRERNIVMIMVCIHTYVLYMNGPSVDGKKRTMCKV